MRGVIQKFQWAGPGCAAEYLRNIYGIWAGGGIFSFEIFKMAEGEEAISKVC